MNAFIYEMRKITQELSLLPNRAERSVLGRIGNKKERLYGAFSEIVCYAEENTSSFPVSFLRKKKLKEQKGWVNG